MSLGVIHESSHLHVWTRTVDGAEFANAIYENEVDAALAFTGVLVNIRKYMTDGPTIAIEHVMNSITSGRGMYVGVPGFVLVLSRCSGGCVSPTWN